MLLANTKFLAMCGRYDWGREGGGSRGRRGREKEGGEKRKTRWEGWGREVEQGKRVGKFKRMGEVK